MAKQLLIVADADRPRAEAILTGATWQPLAPSGAVAPTHWLVTADTKTMPKFNAAKIAAAYPSESNLAAHLGRLKLSSWQTTAPPVETPAPPRLTRPPRRSWRDALGGQP